MKLILLIFIFTALKYIISFIVSTQNILVFFFLNFMLFDKVFFILNVSALHRCPEAREKKIW